MQTIWADKEQQKIYDKALRVPHCKPSVQAKKPFSIRKLLERLPKKDATHPKIEGDIATALSLARSNLWCITSKTFGKSRNAMLTFCLASTRDEQSSGHREDWWKLTFLEMRPAYRSFSPHTRTRISNLEKKTIWSPIVAAVRLPSNDCRGETWSKNENILYAYQIAAVPGRRWGDISVNERHQPGDDQGTKRRAKAMTSYTGLSISKKTRFPTLLSINNRYLAIHFY